MILDNGVIRTMDPSLPTCAALAIAGPLVAGGVGTHEWALPTPERVDLAGRCVVPGLGDAHVHFPTWSLAAPRRAARGLRVARGGARPRRPPLPRGTLAQGHRLARRRLGGEAVAPRRSTRSPGTSPRRCGRRTTTPSGSTRPRSRSQTATSRCRAASSSATTRASRPGILREESAWRFRDRFVTVSEDEWVEATSRGDPDREQPRRHRTCTTRTAGSARRRSSAASTSARA